MNSLNRSTSRCGVSLIELIVVMSAASVILSLSAGLIHRVMHAETAARSLVNIERTSLRLATILRRDANAATTAITDTAQLADGVFLRLESSAGSSIEYRREGQIIHRSGFDRDRIVSREQFAFAAELEVQVTTETSQLILVTITSRGRAMDSDPDDPVQQAKSLAVDLQVVAALQRDGQ